LQSNKVLLTGSGGIGGVNFARALNFGAKLTKSDLFIVGTDFNDYYIKLPKVDASAKTPRHSDPYFVERLKELIGKYKIDFLHPNPSSEAKVVAQHLREFKRLGIKTFLPKVESISPSKEFIWKCMRDHNVPVPDAFFVSNNEDIKAAFKKMGTPLWIRANEGAGARLSLKVASPKEAELWIDLNLMQGRVHSMKDFVLQEYFGGRDIAFDSLWFEGKLISSSTRVRLEYPMKHISLTGLTGTPSVARIIHEEKLTKLGIESVKALDRKPHGFYSTDIKEDDAGNAAITEVDGKWHTTASLWGYALAKIRLDNTFNVAFTYLLLGLGQKSPEEYDSRQDLFPEGFTMTRQMDSGVVLSDRENKRSWHIL
jgi:hypothetical protein